MLPALQFKRAELLLDYLGKAEVTPIEVVDALAKAGLKLLPDPGVENWRMRQRRRPGPRGDWPRPRHRHTRRRPSSLPDQTARRRSRPGRSNLGWPCGYQKSRRFSVLQRGRRSNRRSGRDGSQGSRQLERGPVDEWPNESAPDPGAGANLHTPIAGIEKIRAEDPKSERNYTEVKADVLAPPVGWLPTGNISARLEVSAYGPVKVAIVEQDLTVFAAPDANGEVAEILLRWDGTVSGQKERVRLFMPLQLTDPDGNYRGLEKLLWK